MTSDAPDAAVDPADRAEPAIGAEPASAVADDPAKPGETAAEAESRRAAGALTRRLAAQWSHVRAGRRSPAELPGGARQPLPASTRQGVPWGFDLAAAFAWRFVIIVVAGSIIVWTIWYLREVTVPLAIALLLAALVSPVVRALQRIGLPGGLASLLVVLLTVAVVIGLLTLAGTQVASGANDLADSTGDGLGQIRDWLKTGPLHASDSQVNDAITQAQQSIRDSAKNIDIAGRVTEIGTAISKAFAGFFIVLFATYFFLSDGRRIWAFLVRLAPRGARTRVDSSGHVAWISLTQFVRATVIVAGVDAIGISVGAAILQVPFVLAIGVLVFLGAFVPVVGAFVAGAVAVLVALAVKGPVVALLMLAVVVVVQQIEAHLLQPFLMGRWVSVHPLAVIFAIAVGILIAGIVGGLIAVPLTAVTNAVVQHLAGYTEPGRDPVDQLADDHETHGGAPTLPSRVHEGAVGASPDDLGGDRALGSGGSPNDASGPAEAS